MPPPVPPLLLPGGGGGGVGCGDVGPDGKLGRAPGGHTNPTIPGREVVHGVTAPEMAMPFVVQA